FHHRGTEGTEEVIFSQAGRPARLALPVRHRLRLQAIAGRARMAGWRRPGKKPVAFGERFLGLGQYCYSWP
ncbi:MAG: hypothetical protein PVG64_08710, partial [Syntrophobacterales bacterium]